MPTSSVFRVVSLSLGAIMCFTFAWHLAEKTTSLAHGVLILFVGCVAAALLGVIAFIDVVWLIQRRANDRKHQHIP